MTIRVLLVTNIYPFRQQPANGMWLLEQIRSLRQRGLEIDVVHFNPKDTRLNYLVGLRDLVKRLRTHRFDVVHIHHTYVLYLACLARLVTAVPLPIVFTIHEQDLLRRPGKSNGFSPLSLLRSSVFLRRLAVLNASFVIFVSRELQEIVAPRGPSEVIPCGVDLDKFKPLDRGSCRRQLGIPPTDIVIFFPADARIMRKRCNLAQEAWRILRARVPSNVTLVIGGDIPHDQMPLYYNAADVVLQTASLEGSPTIIKEALACEVPIVSTDAGDTREMLERIPFCVVCNDNAGTLADHLQMALTHKTVGGRDRIREKGLAL